jgi:AraC-like DNA-binding protein
MDKPPLKVLRFFTDDFPERQRVEAYHDVYSRIIVRHDMEPIGDRPFHFESSMYSLPGFGLAMSTISPCRRIHGLQHIDSDDLVLGVSVGFSDGCLVQTRGREAVLRPGEAVLTSCADPADVLIPSTSRPISLRISRSILTSKVADIDAHVARRIPRNNEGLLLLTGYIRAIANTETLTKPDLPKLIAAHVYDLVALILGATGDARELAENGGVRAARLGAILREIDRRSGDPGLSAIGVAVRLGVTPRYVHLLLEETGRSFTHHVLEQRLEKAAALLRDAAWHDRKISDIAVEAGFTDLSYFNRAFRRRFGGTPSDLRDAARPNSGRGG